MRKSLLLLVSLFSLNVFAATSDVAKTEQKAPTTTENKSALETKQVQRKVVANKKAVKSMSHVANKQNEKKAKKS